MGVKVAQFRGVLDIPLSYNCRVPVVSGDSLSGAFSLTSASDPCLITNEWQTPSTQHVTVTRYHGSPVDFVQTYKLGVPGVDTGPVVSNGAVMIGAYLFDWAGRLGSPGTGGTAENIGGASYCNATIANGPSLGMGTSILSGAARESDFDDRTVNGTMEGSFFGLPFAFRVATDLIRDSNPSSFNFGEFFPPYMFFWNPYQKILIGFEPEFNTPIYANTFFGNDPEAHQPAQPIAEWIVGNSPDHSTGMNFTLYCDSQVNHSPSTTNYYISAWKWVGLSGLQQTLETLYSQIAFSDPDFPYLDLLQYQEIHSVSGGFIFMFRGGSYNYKGTDYYALFMHRDGGAYYLLNAVWLFDANSIIPGNTTVFNNANTDGFAVDKFGTWYASVRSNDNTVHFVGNTFVNPPVFYKVYYPGNLVTKPLPCLNPCMTFPMIGK